MGNKDYLILLSTFALFGPKRIALLLDYFGSAKKVWNLSKGDLTEVGVKESLAGSFVHHRMNFNTENYFIKLEKLQIKCVTIFESSYPKNLKEVDGAPIVLYILGNLSRNDEDAVAIVGSRKMTTYGREIAAHFAASLANYGITIVSGLALGIDAVAQRSAIDAGGRSIAVLASGLDKITPFTNYNLAKAIIDKGGAIVSEAPLGAEIFRSSFPVRNRIVSGLSKAVLVVEGERKSGTLLTASHAAVQGRTVFAVPGQIYSPMSAAPHFLIQNGAKMATSPKDILDELNLQVKVDKDAVTHVFPDNEEEKSLSDILENEPLHLDEIARISKVEVAKVSSTLMSMQLKGMVKDMGGGVYKRI